MFNYRLFGYKIATDIEFPQLIEDKEYGDVDITIAKGEIPEEIKIKEEELYFEFGERISWLVNSTTWLLVEEGCRITYALKENASVMKLRNYILGFGISMVGHQRGKVTMHCGVVGDEKGAVLIAGESGAGKSTLTSAFLERGYYLMADDIALVEMDDNRQIVARSAFPYQKLCRNEALRQGYNLDELIYINEAKDKFLVPYCGEFPLHAVPVRALVILNVIDGDLVNVKELQGIAKFHACVENLFLRHLLGTQKYAPYIGQKCLEIASGVPVYVVGRPEEKDTISEVVGQVFEIISKLG